MGFEDVVQTAEQERSRAEQQFQLFYGALADYIDDINRGNNSSTLESLRELIQDYAEQFGYDSINFESIDGGTPDERDEILNQLSAAEDRCVSYFDANPPKQPEIELRD